MTEDSTAPPTDHRKGSIKEALGKLTGDVRIEAEGRRQKRQARAARGTGTKPAGSDRD
ncbi:CsbD family protein [Methylobacterium sp. E-046]|uniref:CsbD family protein n=1 Tax=Methylobacterium sp. E-046 TaxID=2836576 RepID=UPI001FBA9965|nr:CsbD family protein [Methylobacterium sp. E-046]MCJ2098372.1 CsbD family protein [Methylobacterium sp. E-046]